MMAAIRFRFLVAGILLAVPVGNVFAQRASRPPGRRRAAPAPAKPAAPETPAPTAKRRTEPPRQADDVAARALVRGVVRSASGEPAGGVKVWLVIRTRDEFEPPTFTNAEADGQFHFPDADDQTLFGAAGQTAAVIARDGEGHLGWFELSRRERRMPPCEIVLRDIADIEAVVVDDAGRPIAGATLVPRGFFPPPVDGDQPPRSPSDSIDLPPELAAEYQATSAADGTLKLARIPRGVQVSCELSAPGVDTVRVSLGFDRPNLLRLAPSGSIAGRVTVPDGDLAVAKGFQLRIHLLPGPAKSDEIPLVYTKLVAVDELGAFRFDGLPPGRYSVGPELRQNLPVFGESLAPLELAPGQRVTDLTLPLLKAQLVRGSVIDGQTGKGVEGAEVIVYSELATQDRFNNQRFDIQRRDSDAKGHFAIWVKPGKIAARVMRVPDQYLTPALGDIAPRDLADGELPTISLSRGVKLEGRVVDESGNPVPQAEIEISGQPFNRRDLPHRSDRTGRFTLSQIDPQETVTVRARTATMASAADVVVESPAAADPLTIVVAPSAACWIGGQIVDEQGQPLPNARVVVAETHHFTAGGMWSGQSSEPLLVAADGTFESSALWAGDDFHLEVSLAGFGPLKSTSVRGEPGMVYDFGPLTLRRRLDVAIEVVDDAGNAIPHASLRVMGPPIGSRRRSQSPTDLAAFEADDLGRLVLPSADPTGSVAVWARSATAVSQGAQVAWGARLARPMRIVVSESFACRFAGSVVDRGGQPVVNAKVAVVWDRRPPDPNRGQHAGRANIVYTPIDLGACEVDAGGAFRTDALWPDERYHLIVTADGFEASESAQTIGAAGETLDLGAFSLRRSDLTIEGRVVDAAGEPIEDAIVVNSGDAREPLQVATGADGRFRFEGLLEGRVYALARKPAYRDAGLRCEAGASELVVRLRRDDEVRDEDHPSSPLAGAPSDEEVRLVGRLIDELWRLRDRLDDQSQRRGNPEADKVRLVRCLARTDLDHALRWSAAEGGNFDDDARLAAAERLAEDDVDSALALIEGIDTREASVTLERMARRREVVGTSDEVARLSRAAAAVGQAGIIRTNGDADDPAAKARAGTQAIREGQFERGRQLIEEAAEILENGKFDQNGWSGEPYTSVAIALAAIDPKRATRIWDAHSPPGNIRDGFPHGISATALAMARVDLRETRNLLRLFEERVHPVRRDAVDRTRLKIAYVLAAEQPKAAISVLDEIGRNDTHTKADACGWLAEAIAPRDPRQAHELIDRAFDRLLDLATSPSAVTGWGSPPVVAARLAVHAQASAYPDMPSLIDRVLAVRLTPTSGSRSRGPSPTGMLESTVNTAMLLALVDREIARELLLAAELQMHQLGASRGAWLQAWALVDLERAEQMFQEELAAQRPLSRPELIENGLLPMLELLSQPPTERARFLLSRASSYYWFPGDD